MTGLLLATILTVGQAPQDRSVRIWVNEGGGRAGGTGTVLASNERGSELILTAKHVTQAENGQRSNRGEVAYRGKSYPITAWHRSTRADLAAVEADLPGTFADMPITTGPDQTQTVWGYGQSGNLHQHSMRLVKPREGWNEYTPGGNEGDSGAGVFTPDGALSGVFVAKAVQNSNAVVVSNYELQRFLNCQTSGSKRVVIFPFFWKRVDWNGGAARGGSACGPNGCPTPSQPVVASPPDTPIAQQPSGGVTVQAPGVGVQVGATGAQGPPGPAGKDGASPDINAIVTAVVTALKNDPSMVGKQGPAGPAGPPGTPAPASAASQPIPFMYREKNPDGTFTTPINLLTINKATGKPEYQLEVDKTQAASTVVPVAPLPAK